MSPERLNKASSTVTESIQNLIIYLENTMKCLINGTLFLIHQVRYAAAGVVIDRQTHTHRTTIAALPAHISRGLIVVPRVLYPKRDHAQCCAQSSAANNKNC